MSETDFGTVIVGAGFTGLVMGIELRRKGIADFVILERADDVGGVWRDNTYPGVGVDTPSKIYQLVSDPHPSWSSLYAKGHELHEYTQNVARRHGLMEKIHFNTSVKRAQWSPDERRWRVETNQGSYSAKVLVTAAGLVADPSLPNVPGIESFEGEWFHSGQWNHDVELRDRQVVVVGTGASAIQFVPEIAPIVGHLDVVQRTPAWIRPRNDTPIPEEKKKRLASVPALIKLERLAFYWLIEAFASARKSPAIRARLRGLCRDHLNTQITDPRLREKLTPDYDYMCKRPLISDDFYPALLRENVELHTGGLREVRANSVVVGDGTEIGADVIIYNTGFDIGVTSPIARVLHDANGRSLADHWGDDPRAYKGMAVPGFPNLLIMQGPNATSGVSSSLLFAEAQSVYIGSALQQIADLDVATFEVKASAEDTWTRWVRKLSKKMVYEVGGCNSYYLNHKGENVVMWPSWTASYRQRTRRFDKKAYLLTVNSPVASPAPASHQPAALV